MRGWGLKGNRKDPSLSPLLPFLFSPYSLSFPPILLSSRSLFSRVYAFILNTTPPSLFFLYQSTPFLPLPLPSSPSSFPFPLALPTALPTSPFLLAFISCPFLFPFALSPTLFHCPYPLPLFPAPSPFVLPLSTTLLSYPYLLPLPLTNPPSAFASFFTSPFPAYPPSPCLILTPLLGLSSPNITLHPTFLTLPPLLRIPPSPPFPNPQPLPESCSSTPSTRLPLPTSHSPPPQVPC